MVPQEGLRVQGMELAGARLWGLESQGHWDQGCPTSTPAGYSGTGLGEDMTWVPRLPSPETITSLFQTKFRVEVPFDLPEIFFFVALG